MNSKDINQLEKDAGTWKDKAIQADELIEKINNQNEQMKEDEKQLKDKIEEEKRLVEKKQE